MVRDAKLDQAYEIAERDGTTVLTVRHRGRASYFMALLIGGPVLVFLIIVSAVALFTGHGGVFVLLAALALATAFVLYLLAGRRRKTDLVFDATGVIRGKTRYRYADIAEYGTHHLDAGKVVDDRSAHAATMEIGNALYIDFGSRRINLVEGLTGPEASQVFSAFDRLYQSHTRD